MPKPKAFVDVEKCAPTSCHGGVCAAVVSCKHKMLVQEAPYEVPFINISMCNGCLLCLPSCPARAIAKM